MFTQHAKIVYLVIRPLEGKAFNTVHGEFVDFALIPLNLAEADLI